MGKKHGIWFDLIGHLTIHENVLNQYLWLISTDETEYTVRRFSDINQNKLGQKISFETTNGFFIDISKEVHISSHDPKIGMTGAFSYNCLSLKTKFHLGYHSAHGATYNPNAPWHDKPHRHEFDGKIQKIDVYSHDHRPKSDQGRRYTWKGCPVVLTFLDHEDWPFVSEFLDEVSQL